MAKTQITVTDHIDFQGGAHVWVEEIEGKKTTSPPCEFVLLPEAKRKLHDMIACEIMRAIKYRPYGQVVKLDLDISISSLEAEKTAEEKVRAIVREELERAKTDESSDGWTRWKPGDEVSEPFRERLVRRDVYVDKICTGRYIQSEGVWVTQALDWAEDPFVTHYRDLPKEPID